MTMRVSKGCAADNAAIRSPSSSASRSAPSCGLRCGHTNPLMPDDLPAAVDLSAVDDTQRRQRLISAAGQLQYRLLIESRRIVKPHIAVRPAQIDLAPVRRYVHGVEGVIQRHALLELMAVDVDAAQRRIDPVGMLPIRAQHG